MQGLVPQETGEPRTLTVFQSITARLWLRRLQLVSVEGRERLLGQ